MVKEVFCLMVANVTRSHTSHVQPLKMFFDLLKGPNLSYPVLKFGDDLSNRNRDMAQNMILRSCDLERSRSSVRSIIFLHCNPHTTYEHTCEVSLRSYWQFLWKTCPQFPQSGQEKERTSGETV